MKLYTAPYRLPPSEAFRASSPPHRLYIVQPCPSYRVQLIDAPSILSTPPSNFFFKLPLVLLLIFSTTMNTTLRMSPRLPSATDPIPSVDTSLDLRINSFCSPENHNHVRDSPGAFTMGYYCLLVFLKTCQYFTSVHTANKLPVSDRR